MRRKLTPHSSLENLKREAKRWLKALRDGDAAARHRLDTILARSPAAPTLRDVQHALALEYGHAGWTALRSTVEALDRSRLGDTDAFEQDADLTALLAAAARGDVAAVRAVLDRRPELVSERGQLDGHTGLRSALHFAVGGNPRSANAPHEQIVDLLLDRGADPNVRDEGDNAYALHFAAEHDDLAVIRMLIEHGADPIGTGDDHELEVIGWATVFGRARPDVVDYLLAHGARHNIFSAVATGNTDAVRAIIAAEPDARDRRMDRANLHRRPLHLAIVKQQPDSLRTLLEIGANTELEDGGGLTPLDQAALSGERAMADLLIAQGATLRLPAAIALERDVERLLEEHAGELAPGRRWGTLIVRAAEHAPRHVVELLLRHGASLAVRDSDDTSIDSVAGYTALHAAAFHGNVAAATVLIGHGASVTARDGKYHATPAGWAEYAKHPDVRDLILRGPIDMFDAIAFDRIERLRTIFDRDAGTLNRPIGALLLREPAPDAWTKPWWTPLAYAVALGKPEAVRALLEIGADPRLRGPAGITLRQLAGQQGSDETLRILDEYGIDRPAHQSTEAPRTEHDALVARFLANACPDHHVRGGQAHLVAGGIARQLLAAHPEIARANLYTAIVCGDLEHVREVLARNPGAARERGGPKGSAGEQRARFVVGDSAPAHPRWEPLLYACFARLDHAATNDNAVEIVRTLLDHGADPNAYFMAGDSRYSPLTGVIGEGEENRLPHPRRDELVRLLLERGANPYDAQVYYNLHFNGRLRWYLQRAYDESLTRGRRRDWDDPEWRMFDMGPYGNGARFALWIALDHADTALAEWVLTHGASANAPPPADQRFPQGSLYEEAARRGLDDMAALLLAHGAVPSTSTSAPSSASSPDASPVEALARACARGDAPLVRTLLAEHPGLLRSHTALHGAARRNDRRAAELLLDLGVPVDVDDPSSGGQTALHAAAFRGAVDVARLLIERGADVDRHEATYGATPLGFAIYAQHAPVIELLARYGSDIWSLALVGALPRLRELLAERPALADAAYPDSGTTPLMRLPAGEETAVAIAELLLAHGADPSRRDQEGLTAADIAASRGMQRVVALLHQHAR